MLTFLRKIRRSLIASPTEASAKVDGSAQKYLLYALGEIALVVIGILIAIQLNNYNESRLAFIQGRQFLDKLEQDLSSDIIYLDSLKRLYENWHEQTEFIFDTVLSGKLERLNKLQEYTVGRTSMNFININRTTFNEMLNSGERASYKNKVLFVEINNYYQFAEVQLKKLNSDNELFFTWILENMDLNLWHRLNMNRNLEHEDWNWLRNPSSIKYKEIETRTGYFQNAIAANQEVILSLITRSAALIDRIKLELVHK